MSALFAIEPEGLGSIVDRDRHSGQFSRSGSLEQESACNELLRATYNRHKVGVKADSFGGGVTETSARVGKGRLAECVILWVEDELLSSVKAGTERQESHTVSVSPFYGRVISWSSRA